MSYKQANKIFPKSIQRHTAFETISIGLVCLTIERWLLEVESKIERERKRDREMKAMKNKASTEVVDIPPIYKLVASENKQIYM